MTDSATAERDYLAELSRRPAARSPSTLGEIWDSEWKRSGLDTLTGVGKPLSDAYDDLVKQTEAAAGKPIGDFVPGLADAASTDERAQLIGRAIASLPEEKRKALEPLTDVRRRASEAAHKTEREASEVSAASSGISGVATSWAAGIARQALDPVNLATLPLGGPLKGPLLKTIFREAGIGALTQAAQEPAIEAGRAELGLEAGFGRGATNVAEAALGAGGLTALFRAGAWAARKAFPSPDIRPADSASAVFEGAPVGEPSGVPISAPAEPAIGSRLVPEDFEALAARAERDQMVDAVAPPTFDPLGHAIAVDNAARAIETGQSIEAWHGSPHDFDRFDMSKIGTGEGAQVYGHGLYFAEKEKVARGYSKSTSNADFIRKVRELYDEFETPEFARQAIAGSKDFTEGQKRLLAALEKDDWFGFDYPHQAVSAALRDAKNFDPSPATLEAIANVGNVYRVSIATDKERFLDWDKPLSEQPPAIQEALRKLGAEEDQTGAEIYRNLSMSRDNPAAGAARMDTHATRVLQDAGIPGIKYLDQGSRAGIDPTHLAKLELKLAQVSEHSIEYKKLHDQLEVARAKYQAETPTRNFVLFDDSLVRITHKNDVPVRVEDLPFPEHARGDAPPVPQVPENRAGLANVDQQISAPKPLGDPVLAREFERVMQEAGDIEVHLGDERVKASEGMRRAESEATAARELTDCIGASV